MTVSCPYYLADLWHYSISLLALAFSEGIGLRKRDNGAYIELQIHDLNDSLTLANE